MEGSETVSHCSGNIGPFAQAGWTMEGDKGEKGPPHQRPFPVWPPRMIAWPEANLILNGSGLTPSNFLSGSAAVSGGPHNLNIKSLLFIPVVAKVN